MFCYVANKIEFEFESKFVDDSLLTCFCESKMVESKMGECKMVEFKMTAISEVKQLRLSWSLSD